ncbi:N-acetylglucosaminyl-phosphatidylinositol biosynthetic protein Spt14 [Virgisporangium aliadipatigenens]|uniref:N-acetylglucosaminyl-phosphatidylinositol biosynthetic protein Spt14 n=1 Tax=Virgisporangium aliadipatigenens TaxID=741659 RepID=A0A8J4DQ88_9ACTN|nr:glycosyltransferase family 4 protein [Virgisporangium aliadipatigenens]GIJ46344.1 N-acetylglucosaminyl-phosphatidylinositol biosynthetic protein Spt14 [Virgisporangium aliadipatigenens]
MRLLLVTRGFPPRVGGVETLCRQLAHGFAARGTDVTVLTFGGRAPRSVERGPFRVLRVPSRGDAFEWSPDLVRVLRGLRADVCHVHNLHSTVAAGVWASRTRPYVLTCHYHGAGHTPAARLLHPAYRRLGRHIVRGAAAVTAVSASEAALVDRHFGIAPEVIPNGVEPVPAAPPTQDKTLVVVSRLVGYKRVDAVLRALAELPGYTLRVIGDGPQWNDLRRLADRLAVADRIRWEQGLSDAAVREAVGAAAVHVNLSSAEAFSYTVLEALAAGTPVVTSGDTALSAWARRFPDAVRTADPSRPAEVAAAIQGVSGERVQVDLGEYALTAVLDRYQRVYERLA